MKILFHENQLCERGTTVALYDYAWFTREFLGVKPIITYNKKATNNNEKVIKKFDRVFDVVGYENFSEVPKIIDKNRMDAFYAIKFGNIDGVTVPNAKNLMHSVFCHLRASVHGDVYAVVSEWMKWASGDMIPYVPHMLNFPEHNNDLREYLGIPKDAMVFGRYGGQETFDIEFVPKAMESCLEKRKDLWFIFMNTPEVYKHPHCIYLDMNPEPYARKAFINTCDAMLHSSFRGETFGLSVLEFAAYNKQIVTYDNYVGARNHILFLQDQCRIYSCAKELETILLNINKENKFDTMYLKEKFSPENVINQFDKIFLEN